MTGQVVESFRRMLPCATVAVATACAGSSRDHYTTSTSMESHRFTLYEEQILKAIEDLSELLADNSIVSLLLASYSYGTVNLNKFHT